MPEFDDKKTTSIKPGEGFKMPKPSMHEGTHAHMEAKEAKRTADIKKQKQVKQEQPTYEGTDEYRKEKDIPAEDFEKRGLKKPAGPKFLMKAAGMVIGANKRRQAGKDAQDKAKADSYASFGQKKLS